MHPRTPPAALPKDRLPSGLTPMLPNVPLSEVSGRVLVRIEGIGVHVRRHGPGRGVEPGRLEAAFVPVRRRRRSEAVEPGADGAAKSPPEERLGGGAASAARGVAGVAVPPQAARATTSPSMTRERASDRTSIAFPPAEPRSESPSSGRSESRFGRDVLASVEPPKVAPPASSRRRASAAGFVLHPEEHRDRARVAPFLGAHLARALDHPGRFQASRRSSWDAFRIACSYSAASFRAVASVERLGADVCCRSARATRSRSPRSVGRERPGHPAHPGVWASGSLSATAIDGVLSDRLVRWGERAESMRRYAHTGTRPSTRRRLADELQPEQADRDDREEQEGHELRVAAP